MMQATLTDRGGQIVAEDVFDTLDAAVQWADEVLRENPDAVHASFAPTDRLPEPSRLAEREQAYYYRVFSYNANGGVVGTQTCLPDETDRVHDELMSLPEAVSAWTVGPFPGNPPS